MRFGGRLHIDTSKYSVEHRTYALIAYGENTRPERCARVWLGASDVKEEGVWRDAETNEILDISAFWHVGQPNGVRLYKINNI